LHGRFLDKTGHTGLNNLLAAYPDKSAYSQCVFGYVAGPGQEPVIFDGRCAGQIVSARGPTDFGWDPIFQPDGHQQTSDTHRSMRKTPVVSPEAEHFVRGIVLLSRRFAELDKSIKNVISHRAKAIEQVKAYFAEQDKKQ
jgi:inosine triphosphate pyrophosphatase